MAKRTGAEFLTDLLKLTDKSSNDTGYRSLLLLWCNKILNDIANTQTSHHWRFLEKTGTMQTAIDQHTYDLPSDIDTNKMFALYERTNDISLVFVPYWRFVEIVADPSNDSGQSVWWTFYAGTLRLYPVPSAVLTMYMDYIKNLTELADNGNSTDVPEKYEGVIIDGVMAEAYKFDKELGDFTSQYQLYQQGLRRMVTDNSMMIAETTRSISHRERFNRRGDVNGRNSLYFPLSRSNM